MTNTKLIIFDLDGVLVDAKEIHYNALNQALKNIDKKISPAPVLSTAVFKLQGTCRILLFLIK